MGDVTSLPDRPTLVERRQVLRGLAALSVSALAPAGWAQNSSTAMSPAAFRSLTVTLTDFAFSDSTLATAILDALRDAVGDPALLKITTLAVVVAPDQLGADCARLDSRRRRSRCSWRCTPGRSSRKQAGACSPTTRRSRGRRCPGPSPTRSAVVRPITGRAHRRTRNHERYALRRRGDRWLRNRGCHDRLLAGTGGIKVLILEAGPRVDRAQAVVRFRNSPTRARTRPIPRIRWCRSPISTTSVRTTCRRVRSPSMACRHAWSAARRGTGAASRCVTVLTTSSSRANSASASTGRSPMTTSSPGTPRPSVRSACAVRRTTTGVRRARPRIRCRQSRLPTSIASLAPRAGRWA